jgi:hypothetical protein
MIGRLLDRQLHHLRHSRKPHARVPSPSSSDEFSLHLIVPPSGEVKKMAFDDMRTFRKFLGTYNGSLCAVDSAGQEKVVSDQKYGALSSVQTYRIDSPFFVPIRNVQHYEQISDKAFEDEARKTMITFMDGAGIAYNELTRVVKDGVRVVAEWEGIFEVDDGRVFFLECKHKMTAVFTSISHLC